jgi:hypothetical protein
LADIATYQIAGADHATLWVYLNTDAYSRPEFNEAGTRNKMIEEKVAWPYLVTWVYEDGQTFDIERPEFIKWQTSDYFNVKFVREYVHQHAEPHHLIDAASDEELEEDEHQIDCITDRHWAKQASAYQYRVRWLAGSATRMSRRRIDQNLISLPPTSSPSTIRGGHMDAPRHVTPTMSWPIPQRPQNWLRQRP